MMNMLALFYISMRSDKPAGTMSGKEEGQGITVDKPFFTSKVINIFSRHL